MQSLQEFFEYDGVVDSTEFYQEPIPICQHNIYKYLPFYIIETSTNKYKIILPETQKSVVELLCIEKLNNLQEFSDELPSMDKIKQKEFANQKLYSIEFESTADFGMEELLAQFYLTYVNQFNFETWYEPLSNIVIESSTGKKFPVLPEAVLVPLNKEKIEIIAELHQSTAQGKYLNACMKEIRELSSDIFMAKLPGQLNPGDRFFFKMNTRSAKDSWFYREQNLFSSIMLKNKEESGSGGPTKKPLRKCEASTITEVISAMIGSERVTSDCNSYLQWKVPDENKPPLQVVIQEWVDFPPELEFRCFCYQGKITAINQLCWDKYIDYLDSDASLKNQIVTSVLTLNSLVHDLLPWKNYILDVIYDRENQIAQICEFNPWGPYSCTGSQLFSWELDSDILFSTSPDTPPVFRTLRPFMKVETQFCLFIKSPVFKLAPSFEQLLARSVPRCPCCRRKTDPKNFVLPPTKLYHQINN